jgi:hypothetical protein
MAYTLLERLGCRLNAAIHQHHHDRIGTATATIRLPDYIPPPAIPSEIPSIESPAVIRSFLADWWYTMSYNHNVWNFAAQKGWVAIRELPIKFEGPKGWGDFELVQPGWIDLCERARIALIQAGGDLATIERWENQVNLWIEKWNAEYQNNPTRRLAIYGAWKQQYLTEKVEEYKEGAKQFVEEHATGIGAGAVLAVAALGAVGLALAYPEATRRGAGELVGRTRRLAGK